MGRFYRKSQLLRVFSSFFKLLLTNTCSSFTKNMMKGASRLNSLLQVRSWAHCSDWQGASSQIPSDVGKKPTDQSVSAAHLSTHPSFCEALFCPTIPLAACPRFTWTLFMGRRFFRMPRACARLQTNAPNVWVEWWIRWDLVVENGVWHSQNKNPDGFF